MPRASAAKEHLGRPAWLHCLGRDAIYWAFRGLQLPRGTVAWLPSFHCGVEVQAALDAGFAVDFFPVKADLSADQAELEDRVRSRPGPVLLIHYFGQGQPGTRQLALLCEELGVALIEDCCHALFSRHEGQCLGTFGPLAAFSLPKVLGTMDGGWLSVDLPACDRLLGRAFTPPRLGARASWPLLALLERKGLLTGWAQWSSRSSDIRSGPELPALPITNRPSNARDYTRKASFASEWMAARPQPDTVRQTRRENWFWLESKLKTVAGYRNALGALAEGTSPLTFPLLVRDRQHLIDALLERRIEPYIFGQWPHPAMRSSASEATDRFLPDHLICLPLHHDLTNSQLNVLADALTSLLPLHGLNL